MATIITTPTTAGSTGTITESGRVLSVTAVRKNGDTPSGTLWLFLYDDETMLTPGGIPIEEGGSATYRFDGGGYDCVTDLNFRLCSASQNDTTDTGTVECNAQMWA